METNYLTDHLKKQFNKVEGNLHEIGESFDKNTVHHFRVSLKRIHAIYQFLEYIFPEEFDAKKEFEQPKRPYKLLGKIRDLQVLQQVLAHYEERLQQHFSAVKKHLTKKRIKRSKNFAKWLKNHVDSDVVPGKDRILEQANKLSDNEIVEKAQIFSVQLIEEANDMVPSNEDKVWHQARKNMRKLRFLLGIIKNIDSKIVKYGEYDMVKKTGNLLGDWHDRIVLKAWLKNYTSNHKRNDKIKGLKSLSKKDRKLMIQKSEKLLMQLNKQDVFMPSGSIVMHDLKINKSE